jgi:uncharacterized tellurite resistance protein B-like protein
VGCFCQPAQAMIEAVLNYCPMDTEYQHRLTIQILMGSAWVDHHLNEAEVAYLQKVLARYHLSQDSTLQALLTTPVPLQQTERWILTFFQDTHQDDRLKLLADIGNLLIADETVTEVEHDLLDEYHELMAKIPDEPDHITTLVENIGHYVKKTLKNIVNKLSSL